MRPSTRAGFGFEEPVSKGFSAVGVLFVVGVAGWNRSCVSIRLIGIRAEEVLLSMSSFIQTSSCDLGLASASSYPPAPVALERRPASSPSFGRTSTAASMTATLRIAASMTAASLARTYSCHLASLEGLRWWIAALVRSL